MASSRHGVHHTAEDSELPRYIAERSKLLSQIENDEFALKKEKKKPETSQDAARIKRIEGRLPRERHNLKVLKHRYNAAEFRKGGDLKNANRQEALAKEEVDAWDAAHASKKTERSSTSTIGDSGALFTHSVQTHAALMKQDLALRSERQDSDNLSEHGPAGHGDSKAEVEDAVILTEPSNNESLEGVLSDISQAETVLARGQSSRLMGMVRSRLEKILISSGYLEPPLDPDVIRLRWQCRCGRKFFGDVHEYRPGGVAHLAERMSRSTGSEVTITEYNDTLANHHWGIKAPDWIKQLTGGPSSGARTATSGASGGLPMHNLQSKPTPSALSDTANNATAPNAATLHLLACAHKTQRQKFLLQDPLNSISTDRELFVLMRQQLKRSRTYTRSILATLSMRGIRGMYFVKFRLRRGNRVEVRDHNPCCTSTTPNTCECIPPLPKVEPSPNAEYRCSPAGPLATWPPVLSQDLVHMLESPQCIDARETWILEQLPKRTKGELQEPTGPPAEGWGVYHQEGVDINMIISAVFVVFLLASLLFAVLWTHFKMDIQGAFGVSSYMITAVGILMAMLATWT